MASSAGVGVDSDKSALGASDGRQVGNHADVAGDAKAARVSEPVTVWVVPAMKL